MANPSMEQVVAMAGEYNLIPVAIRLLADMETPIRIFQRYAERKRAFYLKALRAEYSGHGIRLLEQTPS